MTSFLSEMVAKQPSGFSLSGKIRAGTKVPTKATTANPQAMALYDRVKKGEISFQAAASEIQKRCGIRNPFYPRNTAYYSAHPWDMESGQVAADKLLTLYGESRPGDEQPRLYRFPVVFPDIHKGGIDAALGSGLAVRGGGAQTIHYQSRYGDDGVRRCVYLPPVEPNRDTTRKQFARREFVVRGLCEPDLCPQYAAGECRFAGTLRFYVPGMPGAGLFAMDTGSTLAASEIYLRLSSLLAECGYLPNFTPDGRPVFWLSKALKQRTYFDEAGNQKKGEQWVPVLETEIDLTKVRMRREQQQALLSAPSSAPAGVRAPAAWMQQEEVDGGGMDVLHIDEEAVGEARPGMPMAVLGVDADGVVTHEEAEPAEPHEREPETVAAVPANHSALSQLQAQAERLGLTRKVSEWALMRFGPAWETEHAGQVLEGFAAINNRFGQHCGTYLDLQIRLLASDIPFQEVALPYFKAKFGGIGLGGNLVTILGHVDELLEQGPSVARSYMETNVS